MANNSSCSSTNLALKATLHLLLLALALRYAKAARFFLKEEDIAPNAAPSASPSIANPEAEHPTLSFFMHDILGGVAPSGRVVAGIVAKANIDGKNIPFSKPKSGVFPINGGIPLITDNTANPKPNPSTGTVISNNGNNNLVTEGNSLPFVTAGQLPQGATLEKLLFGTVTVIDDEITEGQEFGSFVIGKAQGFHLASSLDGSSQTMAFTAIFGKGDHEEEDEDTISFFGVHRTAARKSVTAVVGGTGKYGNAKGYGDIETLHLPDQHSTDGVDTILKINVYLTKQ